MCRFNFNNYYYAILIDIEYNQILLNYCYFDIGNKLLKR